jgi:hypothetical protein
MSAAGRLRRLAWRTGTLAVLAGALAVLLAGRYELLFGVPAGSTADAPPAAACLPGQPVPVMDSPHVPPTEAGEVEYSSVPPTSGPHYSFTVATGVYRTPVPEGLSVHAMEHGHVVIQYAPGIPDGELAELTRLAKRYGADVILAPYPALDHGIALTAWGRIDTLDRYDQERIAGFVERLRGRYHHGWTAGDSCVARPG